MAQLRDALTALAPEKEGGMKRVACSACGGDCSYVHVIWKGDPYHIACLPWPKKLKPASPAPPNAKADR